MAESKVFFERNSWYHRTKTLMPDHTIKYGKKGGFKTEEETREYEKIANEEFQKSLAKTIVTDKENISFKDYLVFWFENIYSPRITVSSQMLGVYILYDLIQVWIQNNINND